MKNRNQMKNLLILLSVILSTMILAHGAIAIGSVATGACTNMQNEGIEYLAYFGADGKDADKWRTNLTVDALFVDNTNSAGRVSSLELEMANGSTRYQCTEVYKSDPKNKEYSCNSLPISGSITAVYIHYIPDTSVVKENTDIRFNIYQTANPDPLLLEVTAKVEYPPYPCARNFLVTKDFVAADGENLVINTGDCDGDKKFAPNDTAEKHISADFLETKDPFALVNITQDSLGGYLIPERLRLTVTPSVSYNYTLRLNFESFAGNTYILSWQYDGKTKTLKWLGVGRKPGTAPKFSDLTEADLPLTLVGGTIDTITSNGDDLWGHPDLPTNTDFDIKFWYTNNEGTLGYENSVFHFERKLNIQFAPYCTNTGIATALYDTCKETRQGFTVSLLDSAGKGVWLNTSKIPFFSPTEHEPTGGEVPAYYFVTRKCADASCASTVETTAYPHAITVSDGDHLARTYANAGAIYHKPGTATVFKLRPYGKGSHEFRITGTTLMVDEPGTYVIYAFLPDAKESRTTMTIDPNSVPGYYYITVPATDSLLTCSTLANNGYFKADWNDCLDPTLTQLMPFEHIQGTEEAWVRNTSAHGVHFPYVSEWSYVPQQLTVASLTCKFEALSAGGRPGDGYCHPDDVYVPPHTKVTITGGTLYLSSIPKQDDYYVAYARRDTWNISHLFFKVYVRECKNVKKIPDTGISLRSPLKVNESVDAATSYVFTGNSLRIPAIGLGMETPIPIVHVYYADGSADNGWDLSTLGNYVGELEGGSYLPYAGNSALTGHYYSMGVFKNLEGLNMGDEVIVYGNDGVKYIYKVVQKFIAQPSDVYEMFQQVGERSLTLVTCENYNIVTDEYERRTIIRAVIDSQDLYEEGIW